MSSDELDPTPDPTTPTPRPRRRLIRILVWTTSVLGLVLLLLAAVVLFRNPLLRSWAKSNIRHETGLEVDIRSLDIGFRSASLSIQDFTLHDPPGFGSQPLLHIPEFYIQLDPARSLDNRLAFEEIRFHLASLNIVRNLSGQLNFESLTNSPAKKRGSSSNTKKLEFAGINKLSLTLGKLSFTDLADPANNFEIALDLHSEANGLNTPQDLTNWFGGLITRVALQQLFSPSKSRQHRSLWSRLLLQHQPPHIPEQNPPPNTSQP